MARPIQAVNAISEILARRSFSDVQINNLIPRLHEQFFKQPRFLAEIVDSWNSTFNGIRTIEDEYSSIPSVAKPPKGSIVEPFKIDMTNILAEVEPSLLLMKPESVPQRFNKVGDLSIALDMAQHWVLLFNSPSGFYLQDWTDLMKKIYYVEHNVTDLLYDKKEQKEMDTHPILKSAAIVEADFDSIRTRYLFALRCGYKELSHLYKVETVFNRPTLKDLILTDNKTYLRRFAPYCSLEEYNAFASLMKSHDLDQDDAEIFERLAELTELNHENM